jgi:hypothetical protein
MENNGDTHHHQVECTRKPKAPRVLLTREGKMNDTNAVHREQGNQLLKQPQSSLRRNMLKNYEGVQKVESPLERFQAVAEFVQFHIRDRKSITVTSSFGEHRFRDVDSTN